jgi:hypothetical protein
MRHLRRCAPFVFVALAAVTCSPRTDDPFVSPAAEPPRVYEEELATLNATARWTIWDRVPLVGKPPWIR